MNYTVTLTDTEKLAMEYIAYEPQDWVENAMKELNEYINNTWEVQKKWNALLES